MTHQTAITRVCNEMCLTHGAFAFIPNEERREITVRLPRVRAVLRFEPYSMSKTIKVALNKYVRQEKALAAEEMAKQTTEKQNPLF